MVVGAFTFYAVRYGHCAVCDLLYYDAEFAIFYIFTPSPAVMRPAAHKNGTYRLMMLEDGRICYSQYGRVLGNCFLRLDVPLIFTGISGFKSLVYGKVLKLISSYNCSIKRLFHPQ